MTKTVPSPVLGPEPEKVICLSIEVLCDLAKIGGDFGGGLGNMPEFDSGSTEN